MAMEFWSVEVECGKTLEVYPDRGRVIHISQATLGWPKKEENTTDLIHLNLEIDGSTISMGSLSAEKIRQLPCDFSFDKGFMLSHTWKNGSVYFCGYSACKAKSSPERNVVPNKKRPSKCGKTPVSARKAKREAPQKMASSNLTSTNKRLRLIDPPHSFEESAFEFGDLVASLQQGQARVKKLLSEGSDFSEDLRQLEADFEEILTLIGMPTLNISQRESLSELIKEVHELWESVECQIEQQQSFDRELELTPSDNLGPVPSAWVVIYDWHDLAYKELLSIRSKYSSLLDHAYKEKHEDFFENNKVSGSVLLMYKKCLNFLAISRDDISALSKEKCYRWVMRIKSIVTQEKYMTSENSHEDLSEPPVSHISTDGTQCNWRDQVYGQIINARKMHSWKLDEAYSRIYKSRSRWTGKQRKDVNTFLEFIRLAMQFLANSRADLVFLTETICLGVLDEIYQFVENSEYSKPARLYLNLQAAKGSWKFQTQHETSLTYWRDVAYQKLQAKVDRFRYFLYDGLYLKGKETWSEEPKFADVLLELDTCITETLALYKMFRCKMSLYASMDDYLEFVGGKVDALCRSKALIEQLQGGTEPEWEPRQMIPKYLKMSHWR